MGMKRIGCILLICMAFLLPSEAQRHTLTFKDVPLTEALLGIEKQQETYRIHFVYNDLENYRVTTRIHQLRTRDAVLAVCENLPVKVWGKGKNIFVESLERSKEESVKTATYDSLSTEKTMVLKEVDVRASSPICVRKAGSLSSILTQEQQDTLTSLALSGKLNSDDIRTLRHMAGYEEKGCRTGRLNFLDLRDAQLVTDRKPYLVLDPKEENVMGFAVGRYYDTNGRHTTYGAFYVLNYPPSADSVAVRRVNLKQGDYTINGRIPIVILDYTPLSNISFDFRFPFTKLIRIWLRRCNMHKFVGHKMKWNGEAYRYVASMKKGTFFFDMFYKCPQLKNVVLPKQVKVNRGVYVHGDSITYSVVKTKKVRKIVQR